MGRTVKSVNGQYHDRIIDIDILLYDDVKVDEPDLKIPVNEYFYKPYIGDNERQLTTEDMRKAIKISRMTELAIRL